MIYGSPNCKMPFLGAVTIGFIWQHRPVIRCIFSFLKKKGKGCRYYRG
jgi:hypothetical protein